MNFLWDVIFFIYLLILSPKLLFERIRGKRHPGFFCRLGFYLPNIQNVIWIHAVSVGEVKATIPLFRKMKEQYPEFRILITTTTATGQDEAKRSIPDADAICYLPLDFSFSVHRFVSHTRPKMLILIEGDIWPNLLKAVQKQGGKTILMSGKLSEKSAKRLSFFPWVAKKLFASLDLLCMQNEEYAKRIIPFVLDPSKIRITGNLKFDIEPQAFNPLCIPSKHPFLTLSCTHAREEELLLDCLKNSPYTLFLAPRHPERFGVVEELLIRKKIPFVRFSRLQEAGGEEKVILVDAMGKLPACYAASKLALVCGSFVPDIGGHNVLEPCLYGCPVLFGPYAFAQKELTQKVISANAGKKTTIELLDFDIKKILESWHIFAENARLLVRDSRGGVERSLEIIRNKS